MFAETFRQAKHQTSPRDGFHGPEPNRNRLAVREDRGCAPASSSPAPRHTAQTIERIVSAAPDARGPIVQQLHQMGRLASLCDHLPRKTVEQLHDAVAPFDRAGARLIEPFFEGKGGGKSLHAVYMDQVDGHLAEDNTVRAGAWYVLDFLHNAFTAGFHHEYADAYDAHEAGLITDNDFQSASTKALSKAALVTAVSAVTGGVAGEVMSGFAAPLVGKSAATVIGNGVGGVAGGVSGHFTADVYDQLLNGKQGFDGVGDYARSGALGGAAGASLAMLGSLSIQSARMLRSANRMGDIYASRYPSMTRTLETLRRAGVGRGVQVKMTVAELLELLRSGLGGPPGPSAFAVATGDVRLLPGNTPLRVTLRANQDLNRPMMSAAGGTSQAASRTGAGDELPISLDEVELDTELSPERWRDALGKDDPSVRAMNEADPVGREPHLRRLPKANAIDPEASPAEASSGFWEDEHAKGNTRWWSDNERVNSITGYQPVEFKDGYVVLDPYAQETVYLKQMVGDERDFVPADRELARRHGKFKHDGTPNQSWAERYRKQHRLTWHHHQDGTRLQLVPRDLHENIPHAGGASAARDATD